MIHYKHKSIGYARNLRKTMTKEERKLWYTFLRYLPMKFLRQRPLGPYIVDFYCAEAKFAIELDGSQHYDASTEPYDAERDLFLNGLGISIARYTNLQIAQSFEAVKADILRRLGIPGSP